MPYKKEYNSKTVKMGGSSTPTNVMGSQGKSASLPKDQYVSRPTHNVTFEQGTAPQKASGRHMPPNHGKKEY